MRHDQLIISLRNWIRKNDEFSVSFTSSNSLVWRNFRVVISREINTYCSLYITNKWCYKGLQISDISFSADSFDTLISKLIFYMDMDDKFNCTYPKLKPTSFDLFSPIEKIEYPVSDYLKYRIDKAKNEMNETSFQKESNPKESNERINIKGKIHPKSYKSRSFQIHQGSLFEQKPVTQDRYK